MSLYELELSDDEADSLIKLLEFTATSRALSGYSATLAQREADRLRKQLPLPVPTKIGAVVRTAEDVFVRVSRDGGDTKQWWKLGEYLTRDEQDAQWTETEDIGRITEVLSEGVDL